MNFASNARDAMPYGGKLIIETMNVYLDEKYAQTHFDTKAGDYVLLAVSDNGVGMDRKIAERIFEPFFTTKEKGKGTGMGLSTVYGIVRQNDGYISVYSEPNHGTTFKIFFPQIKKEKTNEKKQEITKKEYKGTETILLVEDEESVRILVADTLKKNGYKVLIAADGEEAIRIYENKKNEIDLMVTDVILPQMGERELAESLIKIDPDLPILFMSGYTNDAILQHKVLEADIEFIHKPFVPYEILRKIRNLLDSGKNIRGDE